MGKLIDGEKDGQPNADATGDGPDDDGITSITALIPGQITTLHLLLTAPTDLQGRLDAWIDFNGNGSWADAGEKIFNSQPLTPGDNTLTFTVPTTANPGDAFARFRLSRQGGLNFDGASTDGGEIEDYHFKIEQLQSDDFDFGDAPELAAGTIAGGYPTTLARDGARHRIVKDVQLGQLIDAETDGQPSADALGDDNAGLKDEDGVVFLSAVTPGQVVKLEVTASVPGRLDAWLDFNGNGSWAETNERIFFGRALTAGANSLTFNVPGDAKIGDTFARFRFSREGVLSFVGPAARWRS